MPTCPNGHQSGSEDWCEVCGHRMAGAGAPAGAVPPPPPPPPAPGYGYPQGPGPGSQPTMQAELCPQCRTPREAMAPFCEECRWNFLTNTATSYTPLAPPHGGPGGPVPGLSLPPGFQAQQPAPPQQQQPRDPFEYQSSRPSQVNRPAETLAPEQGGPGGPGGQGGHGGQAGPGGPGGPGAQAGPGGPGSQGGHPGPPPSFQQGPPPPPSFQQQSAPSPSPFAQQPPAPFPPHQQQQSAPPAPPQPQAPQTGADDWMLSPPSQAQAPPSHQAPPAPQLPQGYQQQGPQGSPQFPGQGHDQGHGHGPVPGQGHEQGQAQQQPVSTTWTAVIAPDREYFLAMMQRSGPEATGLNLPAYSPEQRLPLTGSQITIGRRRHSTGESPDVDLSVPPEDPGVSHQHAVLVQQPDGSWAVVDQNSTNGTTLNGAEDPIQPYVPVPLQDGDQVHVGAWTTITVRRD
ncbi:FHA domain-containing protein [Streptomyces sp. BE308]|uniref:FHA domain-containing protein n=1 Tax=Streptomyces sp. BE308 TaxID=3002529 RepID=UPI002E79590F|nr:FHA domain-containing protein [Streptomyces sp. BE308]MEE1792073.1 FHA domain-containing protein [Streptomyces sp. BE308]